MLPWTERRAVHAMRACERCGYGLEEDFNFCPRCGFPVEVDIYRELFGMVASFSRTLDSEALVSKIGDAAKKLLDAEASSIWLLDEERNELYFKVATGAKAQEVKKLTAKVGEGVVGWVVQENKPVVVNDVGSDPRFARRFDEASGFVTRSMVCVPMVVGEKVIGAVQVLNKRGGDFREEDLRLLESFAGLAAIAIENSQLVEDQKNFFIYIIDILVTAIEFADPRKRGHSRNVARIALSMAMELGMEPESKKYNDLYYASLLHDIGMIAPREGMEGEVYADWESSVEAQHPVSGAKMIEGIRLWKGVVPIIRWHHENYDGTGYPDGISGEEIPIEARILAIAEGYDEFRIEMEAGGA
jgi:putative nucleotidyltransferase with HDIG domain